ncbi:hypothetical protein [Microbulbifer hydrolyticus]|uniref:Lipoprotein n=1 Tax=Microbulbifer hydrolyticus TaxID=48074 RepID=A0A6P1T8K9_9GAMM|nr:hypothetical protein [Microbulbifer hydrolyticus]MBB5211358.1 hypothetical protein [Microbulbifer hydrolyticus]QHQ37886.1 hypothetical protein GTQ55_01990 [Microbulbifer hydrolyticus]
MGKRLTAIIALITLALVMAACDQQACYQDGNSGKRKPPMPFASTATDLSPVLSLIHPY